jgi:hypothetical protein
MLSTAAKNLPEPVKIPLRRLYGVLSKWTPAAIRHQRWVANTYIRHTVKLRESLFLTVANYAHINRPLTGYYFEFGCCNARTMRLAWDSFHRLFDWQFVGFDSFEGFPEIAAIDQQDIFKRGGAAYDEQEFLRVCLRHGMAPDRLTTVKGFYDASLNEQTRRRFDGRKAALIYVDCDLYTSTVPVLEFCRSFLQRGTVVIFDDWACFHCDPDKGERLAWREFLEKYPELKFEPLASTGLQAAFVCVLEFRRNAKDQAMMIRAATRLQS